jgi:flavin reductase (DIM6/NTAB) family NADH-FMN oxidoreductase RutF
VSATSREGIDNLAPYSLFTLTCTRPPIVQFTSIGQTRTLRNALETLEFVINVPTEQLISQVESTAHWFPPDVSKFDAVGIAREPSAKVRPPRVATCPAALECRLYDTLQFEDSTVVFGRVVHVAVDSDVLMDGLGHRSGLRPLARWGTKGWMVFRDPPAAR